MCIICDVTQCCLTVSAIRLIVETFQNQLMHFCLATLIIIVCGDVAVTLGHICGWCGHVVVVPGVVQWWLVVGVVASLAVKVWMEMKWWW